MISLLTASADVFYQALLNKDVSYEGTFIAAVKTTGIFCRPTCRARKPKKENVEFFRTTGEAMQHGYRPCKVCRPLEKMGETPGYIAAILHEISRDPSRKLNDGDLRQKGVAPSKLRRWFLKHHGITFHAYQRMFRINAAFQRIQTGEAVTSVAFETGYESLSGFTDSFKAVFGVAPAHSQHKQVINLTRLETPLGTMVACAVAQGICLLEFSDRRMLETELKALHRLFDAPVIQSPNPHFDALRQQLAAYFAGTRRAFSVPVCTPGTAFQQAVWQALQQIPYGTTRSYKQQAVALQQPDAVRAVARANGMNRIAILIPCHRVIGADGHLTGYGGGLWRKKWLLDREKGNRESNVAG